MPKPGKGTYISSKGYPRISAGKHRNKYVHIMVAEAMLGRPLKDDEDVHHRDLDKQNPEWTNLLITGHTEHGAITRRQAWFLRNKEAKELKQWQEWIETGENKPDEEQSGESRATDEVSGRRNPRNTDEAIRGRDSHGEGQSEDVSFP